MKLNTTFISSAVALLLLVIGSANAVVVISTNSSSNPFAVANNDLLEGILGSVGPGTLNGQEGTSNNAATLTNGTFGTAGNPLHLAETVAIGNNTTITWQLDLGASPSGYDITGINTYSGWRDAGRDRQDFTARIATVADPGNFIDIATVSGFNPNPNPSGESRISDTSGILASGVGQVQLFFAGQENGYVGYREVDVIGVAPSSFTIGAGVAIPHEVLDNQSGPRMNIDDSFTITLGPGTYKATDFEFSTGRAGEATPFLAVLNGANYEIIAVGDAAVVGDGNMDNAVKFGGDDTFTLDSLTEIFAGFTNEQGTNPVFLDNGTPTTTDHDGTPVALTGIGQLIALSSISNQNLGRTYAFSVDIQEFAVPEPATATLALLGLGGLVMRRRRNGVA